MTEKMRVYTSTNFEGWYPVGTAAVVVAENPEQARALLEDAIRNLGIPHPGSFEPGLVAFFDGDPELQELDLSQPSAVILRDGNY